MKKSTLILFIVFTISINLFAQIPNNGFETWATTGSYEQPVDWATMNPYSPGTFYSCTKSTDHYPASVGSYSARLENNTSLTQMTGAYGMIMTHAFDWPFKPAFPIVGHPNSLCGYYKFNPLNNDSLFISIVFFQSGSVVTYNTYVTGVAASSWTPFNFPLTYTSADSATIQISAFYPNTPTDGPKGNSVLYIDNMSFNALINVPEMSANKPVFNIFPNPASGFITLNIKNINIADLTLNIYNVVGELICSEAIKQNQQQINVADLSNGMYIVEVKSSEGSEKQELVIQK